MRKYWKYALIPVLLSVLLLLSPRISGWKAPEEMPLTQELTVQWEILRAAECLTAEEKLIAAGYPVIDADSVYPEYLANSGGLRSFAEGAADSFSFFRILEDGARYLRFWRDGISTLFFTADLIWEDGQLTVEQTSLMPVYDMELADWDIFYYRLYPAGDPHYIDYTQLRLAAPDREAHDLARKYILPVGYQMVNLFLVDWKEGDWGELSFSDAVEFLYRMKNGEFLPWEGFSEGEGVHRRMIPADVFEETVLEYFPVSREELRTICGYTQEGYQWRFVHGDDLTIWRYPMCEPEVREARDNGDGTLTLVVQVYSPELKTDRLFCHELTVRLLEGERFQYVGNRVTYVSERGLPPNMARIALD